MHENKDARAKGAKDAKKEGMPRRSTVSASRRAESAIEKARVFVHSWMTGNWDAESALEVEVRPNPTESNHFEWISRETTGEGPQISQMNADASPKAVYLRISARSAV